jgi:glutamine amidotransferase
MCAHSEENDTPCLDIFQEKVKRFVADESSQKIPQIGWNTIHALKSPLFNGIAENSHCYFVHSYYASLGDHTIAQTDYCGGFSAALQTRNYYGVQFHPEKSAEVGSAIIKNFLNII